MPERNIELLERTMQQIKDHPETHDQGEWWCGSTGCFFGWAVALSNLELDNGWEVTTVGPYLDMELPDAAAALLGLNKREARVLSDGGNTIPELELMVKDLVNGDKLRRSEDYEKEVNGWLRCAEDYEREVNG